MEILKIKTTPGVGDYMMGLNRSFLSSLVHHKKFLLEFHWYHDKDFIYHHEDPETIYDRFNYSLNHYIDNARLPIKHVFNSDDQELFHRRFIPSQGLAERGVFRVRQTKYDNIWAHHDSKLPENTKKVVIWRASFNAEPPREWKTLINHDGWDTIIKILEGHGYEVVELTYRTPISEVYYHIATCHFCVGYDGMWHYVAKNYWKPMLILSRSAVTKYHTKHAIPLNEAGYGHAHRNIIWAIQHMFDEPNFLDKGHTLYHLMTNKAIKHKNMFWELYDANRSRGY